MAHYLVIVESPAKVKTIKKFLGSNYTVAASQGHVRDLPKSSLGIDVEHDYEPKYITIRGKGIGGEMLETLIDLCSDMNLKTFTLEVNVENTPAIKLYEKFGFKNLGIRKKYYNNTTDAYIMTKYDI